MTWENRIRLLIVDDEKEYIENIRPFFESRYEVRTASNGREALELLQAEADAPFVVMADERMPEMTGRRLFEEMRARRIPHLGRILVTGFGDKEMAVAAFNQGLLDNYVEKPVASEEKVRLLRQYIDTVAGEGRLKLKWERHPAVGEATAKAATMGRLVEEILNYFRDAIHELLQRESIVAGTLRKFRREPSAHDHLGRIEELLEKNQQTFSRIQEFFRASGGLSGPTPEHPEGRSVHDILHAAAGSLAAFLLRRQVTIKMKLAAERDFLRCIPSDLYYVFANLLLRAATVSPPGSRLLIRSRNLEDTLRIEVADAGKGAGPADLEALQTASGGEGPFDLSLAPQLLGKYGGKMEIEPRRGTGTTVAVELPVSAPAE